MKTILLLIAIHILASTVAKAETTEMPVETRVEAPAEALESEILPVASPKPPVDECKETLPQIENEYRELETRFHTLRQNLGSVQESYLTSFNQMTQVLFQITQAREEETALMARNRDQLRESMQKFNDLKSDETSRQLQEKYLNLTLQIYSSLSQSQKTLESMKSQLQQVEASRSNYISNRQEIDQIDHQKLALEAKMVSLKIKCNPEKKY